METGRITVDPLVMGGEPCIPGHRMPVSALVRLLAGVAGELLFWEDFVLGAAIGAGQSAADSFRRSFKAD